MWFESLCGKYTIAQKKLRGKKETLAFVGVLKHDVYGGGWGGGGAKINTDALTDVNAGIKVGLKHLL